MARWACGGGEVVGRAQGRLRRREEAEDMRLESQVSLLYARPSSLADWFG